MNTGNPHRTPNLDPLTLPLNGSTLIEASAAVSITAAGSSARRWWSRPVSWSVMRWLAEA